MDNGGAFCAAFLDCQKAFDFLDHCILLQWLYDMYLYRLLWFKSYLSDKAHRVKCNIRLSFWHSVKGCIPQGSALGPLLFLIYMNSLPCQISEGLLLQYADDTTLICSGPTPEAAANTINARLKLLNQWATDSRMKLNYSKSTVMWFKASKQSQRHYHPIVVGTIVLNVVTNQRYLGLVFDQNLSWDQHASHIYKRMSYYLYAICCHRNVLNSKLLKRLLASQLLSICLGHFSMHSFITETEEDTE